MKESKQRKGQVGTCGRDTPHTPGSERERRYCTSRHRKPSWIKHNYKIKDSQKFRGRSCDTPAPRRERGPPNPDQESSRNIISPATSAKGAYKGGRSNQQLSKSVETELSLQIVAQQSLPAYHTTPLFTCQVTCLDARYHSQMKQVTHSRPSLFGLPHPRPACLHIQLIRTCHINQGTL